MADLAGDVPTLQEGCIPCVVQRESIIKEQAVVPPEPEPALAAAAAAAVAPVASAAS